MRQDPETRNLVDRLISDSAMHIDRGDFDAWLDCFADEARYLVVPRENRALNLPAAIIQCDTKAILKDRITVLRHASKYNPHYDRHIVSGARIVSVDAGVATTEANFMIVQSTLSGVSKLFCAGCYEDRIRVAEDRATFLERLVVLDTFSVPNLIATPL